MSDALAEAERAKYERVWAECELYHRSSPGLRHAPEAFGWFQAHECRDLIDYGCGDGRALDWFSEQNPKAFMAGIDIANERTDAPIILKRNLWDELPAWADTDFAFCCDVLEHIPPEKVDAVLANIAAHMKVAGWFQIALFEDTAGTKGDWGPLHLTVKGSPWWLFRLQRYFHVATYTEKQQRLAVWLLPKKGAR